MMLTMAVSIFVFLKVLSKAYVQSANNEKANDYPDENEVAHRVNLTMSEIL